MRYLCILLCLPVVVMAQKPQAYFRMPMDLPLLLAGNFGECRPGHFHSGIDIKTGGKENERVYAAAAGYISRIKMEPGGFGHAIYITHPDGYTTLYAHLNTFFPALQALVHREQYEHKNWELDLNFGPDRFPVKKGQFIAFSGNTGGSTAPHLHFEIRDTKTEHPLNPLLFGFAMEDNIAPVPYRLALYDNSRSIYEQDPRQVKLRKTGQEYRPQKDTITVSSAATGLGIFVNDFMNGSDNTLAVYTIAWYLDHVLQGRLVLDDIGYDETRYLNACADYKLKKQSGDWYNSLFVLKENKLEQVYKDLNTGRGVLQLPDHQPHQLRVELTDAKGNQSLVQALLQWKDTVVPASTCNTFFNAAEPAVFNRPNVQFTLAPGTLYDDICFRFEQKSDPESFAGNLQLHEAYVPMHRYTDIAIKPDKPIPFALTAKMVIVVKEGSNSTGKAAVLKDGWYHASLRSFGQYRLLADTVAPGIKPLLKNGIVLKGKKELRFVVHDKLSRVSALNGMLDGRWVCMEQHGEDWFYKPDEYCPAGKHKLQIKATDESGNTATLNFSFTR